MESTLDRKRLKLELSKGQEAWAEEHISWWLMLRIMHLASQLNHHLMVWPDLQGHFWGPPQTLSIPIWNSCSIYSWLTIWVMAMPFSQLIRLETLLIIDSSLSLTLTFKPPNPTRSFQRKGEVISKFRGWTALIRKPSWECEVRSPGVALTQPRRQTLLGQRGRIVMPAQRPPWKE